MEELGTVTIFSDIISRAFYRGLHITSFSLQFWRYFYHHASFILT